MRPKQQHTRETINPVTGLIHQARKCLAECAAAYIVRRSWRPGEVQRLDAQEKANSKGRPCIQSGRNYVE
jgi:hypothetical protein